MTEQEQTQPLVIDCEHFEPWALKQLDRVARNFVRGAEDPWDAFVWVEIWLAVAEAMGGAELDLDPIHVDALEFLNPERIDRATKEAEILKARKDSGRCLECGEQHENEHEHESAHVN
jgi:hypothetical protein